MTLIFDFDIKFILKNEGPEIQIPSVCMTDYSYDTLTYHMYHNEANVFHYFFSVYIQIIRRDLLTKKVKISNMTLTLTLKSNLF